MITDKNINLFHRTNIEREIIPNKYQLIKNNINEEFNSKTCLTPVGNLSKNQEDQIIFSNHKNKFDQSRINKIKYFGFSNIINIDKTKLITYLLCNNYEELFHLFELYITSLFNGTTIEKIPILFERFLISDLIFVNAISCINIIKFGKNSSSDNYIACVNINNILETTEIFYRSNPKEKFHSNSKFIALLLVLRFVNLLKSIDEKCYIKEIKKLEEIIGTIENKKES